MGQFLVTGENQPQIPPPTPDFVPPPKPPIPGRANDGNDGGALWWDRDDPGQAGADGESGDFGIDGQAGLPGGSVPMGTTIVINREIDGIYHVLISGGKGQPGGDAGRGGDGGRGQDGGHGDDEQPAGSGGRGGRGGNGGRGGAGGNGGNIFEVDIIVGPGIDASQVAILYTQGFGASGGRGGDPGAGGGGGTNGDGGTTAMQGDAGINPGFGPNGTSGIVSPAKILA